MLNSFDLSMYMWKVSQSTPIHYKKVIIAAFFHSAFFLIQGKSDDFFSNLLVYKGISINVSNMSIIPAGKKFVRAFYHVLFTLIQ